MTKRLNRWWRTAATGFCFFVFGAGQVVQALLVFPLVMLLVRDPKRRRDLGKRVMQRSFKSFVELMRLTGVLEYRLLNVERLDRPGLLLLSNHPTLIDVVFLISLVDRADCIIKGPLLRNPFTRFAVTAAGLIPNTDGGAAMVERCTASMNEGNTLVVFPEGSRSEKDRLLPFQRGASHIAVRARKDITPVVIHVSEHNLGRGAKWWQAPPEKVRFVFDVKEDLPVRPFIDRDPDLPAAARVLSAHLTDFFSKELASHGNA
jgi:1-acyl-sn-glycerol-3-phosphate acyltransferase